MPEELQNGGGFGYVVAFRPVGTISWMQTVVVSPDASRYVFRNESLPPFSPYEVKVGVYNNKGEGPFSPVTVVYSADEGKHSQIIWQYMISWLFLKWPCIPLILSVHICC